MPDPDALLGATEKVVEILGHHHIEAIVIGAVALAAHHYVRERLAFDERILRGSHGKIIDPFLPFTLTFPFPPSQRWLI